MRAALYLHHHWTGCQPWPCLPSLVNCCHNLNIQVVHRPTTVKRKRRQRADPWAKKRKPNPNPKPRRPPPAHFTCRICIEEKPSADFIQWEPFKRRRWRPLDAPHECIDHLARNPSKRKIDPVCKSCVGNTMAAKLDTLGVRRVNVGCLEPGCDEQWDHTLVLRYMPAGPSLEKYNMEMFQVWKETADPAIMTCLSPGCNSIGLPDIHAAGYPQVACNTCSFRSCAQCRVPWHKDVTCAEYAAKRIDDQMSDSEKSTLKLMQSKDAKRCPNCQMVIEKDGGCDSMTCGGCKKYFNWGSAASAVTGAKKPEQPYIQNGSYYFNPHPGICEADESGKWAT